MNAGSSVNERFVYLVQHGEAKPKQEDPERPLTEAGKETVEQVAAWAARMGLQVDQVRHSGKLRAQQTAAILAQQLQPREGIATYPGLAPNDDVRPVAEALATCPCSLMLVGHLPFLSRLAGALLLGDPRQEPIRFQQGGLVGLVTEGEGWKVACVVPPELTQQPRSAGS